MTRSEKMRMFEPISLSNNGKKINAELFGAFSRTRKRFKDQTETSRRKHLELIHNLSSLFVSSTMTERKIYKMFLKVCDEYEVNNKVILIITLVWNEFKNSPLIKKVLDESDTRKMKSKHYLKYCYSLGHGYSFSQINACNRQYGLELIPEVSNVKKVDIVEDEIGKKIVELCSFILYGVMDLQKETKLNKKYTRLDEVIITKVLCDINEFVKRVGVFKISGGKFAHSKVASALVVYVSKYYTDVNISRALVSKVMNISEATIRNHGIHFSKLAFDDMMQTEIQNKVDESFSEMVLESVNFICKLIAKERTSLFKKDPTIRNRNDKRLPRVIQNGDCLTSVRSLLSVICESFCMDISLDEKYVDYFKKYTNSDEYKEFIVRYKSVGKKVIKDLCLPSAYLEKCINTETVKAEFNLDFNKKTLSPRPSCTCCQSKVEIGVYYLGDELERISDEYYSSALWKREVAVLCKRCKTIPLHLLKKLIDGRITLFFHQWI